MCTRTNMRSRQYIHSTHRSNKNMSYGHLSRLCYVRDKLRVVCTYHASNILHRLRSILKSVENRRNHRRPPSPFSCTPNLICPLNLNRYVRNFPVFVWLSSDYDIIHSSSVCVKVCEENVSRVQTY